MTKQPDTTLANETNEFLTTQQVMAMLKISRKTVWAMTKTKQLQGYKIGGSLRYKLSDVQSLPIPMQ